MHISIKTNALFYVGIHSRKLQQLWYKDQLHK